MSRISDNDFSTRLFLDNLQQIQKHKTFMSIKKSFKTLFSRLERSEISFRLFGYIKKHEEMLCDIYAYLKFEKSKNVKKNFKLEKKACKERIEMISKVTEQYEAKLVAVESAIRIARNVSRKLNLSIFDINEVIKALENCKNTEKLVVNLQHDDFWGILSTAVEASENLEDLLESASFKRVSERCWKKEKEILTSDMSTVKKNKISLLGMLTFLTETCIKTFCSEWEGFLTKPDGDGQTIEKLEDLVGADVSKEVLGKEISIVAKYLKKKNKFPDAYVHSFAARSHILKNVQNALSVLCMLSLDSKQGPDKVINKLKSFESQLEDKSKLSIKTYHTRVEEMQKYLTVNSRATELVLQQLAMSPDVVNFVQKTVNEDLHFMVEEVAEHEEQLKISEALVTKLIQVHHFLKKIIRLSQSSTSAKKFLSSLDKLIINEDQLENKLNNIADCNKNISSLDGLYESIAHRVEVSKWTIANCLNKGKYCMYK